MEYFKDINDFRTGKLIYRRLALLNHPDMGGNPDVMKKINTEYQEFKKSVSIIRNKFINVRKGDTVIINGSMSLVIDVGKRTFTAKSYNTGRVGEFLKQSGICINNPKFVATRFKEASNAG